VGAIEPAEAPNGSSTMPDMATARATGDVAVRAAQQDDLDVVHALHVDAVLHSTAIWRDEPLPRTWFDAWLVERAAGGFPVLVAEVEGATAGYATYGPWHQNPGYRHTVEDSVYVRPEFHGRGVASRLMTALVAHAREDGRHVMLADIAAENAASIRLHERLGFERMAVLPEVGRKFDRWLDLVIMRLPLV